MRIKYPVLFYTFSVSKACSDGERVKTSIPPMGDFAHVSRDLPACAFSLHARLCANRCTYQGGSESEAASLDQSRLQGQGAGHLSHEACAESGQEVRKGFTEGLRGGGRQTGRRLPRVGGTGKVTLAICCAWSSEADAKTCTKPGVECGGASWAKATWQSGLGAMRAYGAERRRQKIPSGGTKVWHVLRVLMEVRNPLPPQRILTMTSPGSG